MLHVSPFPMTLALLKPDLLLDPFAVQRIFQRIRNAGLIWYHQRTLTFRQDQAQQFYIEHQGRFFYERLLGHMTSGPFMALLLQCSEEVKEPFDAISNWRQLMGPTRPASAQLSHPNSLRGLFALTDVRNALHGSDSPESVYREAQIIFPSINLHTLIQEMRKKSNSIT